MNNSLVQTRRIKIVRGIPGLHEIKDDWEQLTSKLETRRYYHFFDWYGSYLKTLEINPDTIFFCVLYCNDKAEAILPLRKTTLAVTGITFDILELPEHSHLPLGDIIFPECYQTKTSVNFLLKQLRKSAELRWDFIKLAGLLPGSTATSALLDHGNAFCITEKIRSCDYLETSSHGEFYTKLSKNMRSYLKKHNKKFAQEGHLSFEQFTELPEVEEAFPIFLEVEASGWKGKQGTCSAIKCHKNLSTFYLQVIQAFSGRKAGKINILRLDDKAISAQYALIVDDTCYLLKIGFDENFKHLSPGNIHLEYLLKYLEKSPEIKFLNLITDAAWHERWNVSRLDVVQIFLFNRTFKGLIFLSLLYMKQYLRPVYHATLKKLSRMYTKKGIKAYGDT